VVDQKLAEEEIRVELSALSETVTAHKKLLEDELVDKVCVHCLVVLVAEGSMLVAF
jgi:hypothetical protein